MNDNKKELIREAYRRGEVRLSAQLSMALAADARATAFSGLMVASAALLSGLAADSEDPISLYSSAFMLFVAAGFSMWSARPVDFDPPGGQLSQLKHDLENNSDYYDALLEMAELMEESEDENEKLMKGNGEYMKQSFGCVVASVPVGFFVSLIG